MNQKISLFVSGRSEHGAGSRVHVTLTIDTEEWT